MKSGILDINYKETYEDYIIDYCNELSEFILEEYEIDIDFKNLSLHSPREYNFETDSIDCEVDKDKANNNKAASWVVKAFVDATPISGPAFVKIE